MIGNRQGKSPFSLDGYLSDVPHLPGDIRTSVRCSLSLFSVSQVWGPHLPLGSRWPHLNFERFGCVGLERGRDEEGLLGGFVPHDW